MSGMSNEDAMGRLSSATMAGDIIFGLFGIRSIFFFGAALLFGGAAHRLNICNQDACPGIYLVMQKCILESR